jgi:predicted amidophosphoribosyltransferase
MRGDWRDNLAREGLVPVQVAMAGDAEHPACPACGTAAALVDGACSDCGLQLE